MSQPAGSPFLPLHAHTTTSKTTTTHCHPTLPVFQDLAFSPSVRNVTKGFREDDERNNSSILRTSCGAIHLVFLLSFVSFPFFFICIPTRARPAAFGSVPCDHATTFSGLPPRPPFPAPTGPWQDHSPGHTNPRWEKPRHCPRACVLPHAMKARLLLPFLQTPISPLCLPLLSTTPPAVAHRSCTECRARNARKQIGPCRGEAGW